MCLQTCVFWHTKHAKEQEKCSERGVNNQDNPDTHDTCTAVHANDVNHGVIATWKKFSCLLHMLHALPMLSFSHCIWTHTHAQPYPGWDFSKLNYFNLRNTVHPWDTEKGPIKTRGPRALSLCLWCLTTGYMTPSFMPDGHIADVKHLVFLKLASLFIVICFTAWPTIFQSDI